MSTWNQHVYTWTKCTQKKLDQMFTEHRLVWSYLVKEIEEDENVTCVFNDEIRFIKSCSDDEFINGKKRAIKLVQKYFKKYC